MLDTIVIATDGSGHAAKAVGLGSDIAAKYGARCVFVHVLLRNEISENLRHMAEVEHLADQKGKALAEAIAGVPEGRFPADISFDSEATKTPYRVLEAIGKQVLEHASADAREHGVKEIDVRLRDGDPVRRILEVAEQEKADMIITGARGLSGLKALMVGSVSHKLASLSPVTVVSVK